MEEGVPVAQASNQVEHVQETWYITEPLVSVVLSNMFNCYVHV